MPVSTDRDGIAQALARPAGNKMRVVFSTYQSLPESLRVRSGGLRRGTPHHT